MGLLLDDAPDVDAVFAVSDLAAVGALMECRRRRIAVPEQLSLLGFGDFEIGRQIVPALSTIVVDFEDIGRQAGDLVAALLTPGEPARPQPVIDVGFTLAARDSTAGAPP